MPHGPEPQSSCVDMEDNSNNAHNVLTAYLNEHKLRKTPERYAILDAVCSFTGHFSLQQLSERMEEQYFRVSRATTSLPSSDPTTVIKSAKYAEK